MSSSRIADALFGSTAKISVAFADAESCRTVSVKAGDADVQQRLYTPGDCISGQVTIEYAGTKRFEYTGIRLELIGQIELLYDKNSTYEFTSLVRELDGPGELEKHKVYAFEFSEVELAHESYEGINVRLRYFLRTTITRQYGSKVAHEETFCVHTASAEPETNNAIKMEVGIEDCLHIEFEYNKSSYHLRDVVLGKIFFLLVRIRIKHMEVAIIKREQTGMGTPNVANESETIAKFEIMDGAPVRGESIPIRLFLGGFEQLTPTFDNKNGKFSVKYFLNLVLVDEEDRRYFKQQEAVFYRKEL
uniref:Vacuolar protein sorting-associated protein 26 n=1 Tax=Calcidiscus leptoporus TaxID=127549 RepID=A0A7S0IUB3_9EUKA|mmetsp:Transcript_23275/g.53854  ORF Transcript_23275/g.53854 Transcript_23275/m.53854 type:complete len:304 (+) Transcript_23275:58-969(+)